MIRTVRRDPAEPKPSAVETPYTVVQDARGRWVVKVQYYVRGRFDLDLTPSCITPEEADRFARSCLLSPVRFIPYT